MILLSSASLSHIREELDRLLFEAEVAHRVFHTSADMEYLEEAMRVINNCSHEIRREITYNTHRPRPKLKPAAQQLLEELGL